jgi:molybdopterin-guanine dinucleotide biosynthesis protein A
MDLAGFILTGGKSSRMGRNKAFLTYSGRTLLDRISAAAAAAAGSVTLIGDPAIYAHSGLAVIPDRFPESGPLAGIEAALAATSAEWNLIVACDMPGMEPEFLAGLCEAAERLPEGTECLVPKTPDGRIHPLCAVYRRRCLEPVRTALTRGECKVTTLVESLRVHYWPVDDLQNVNTPLEWSRFLESRPA